MNTVRKSGTAISIGFVCFLLYGCAQTTLSDKLPGAETAFNKDSFEDVNQNAPGESTDVKRSLVYGKYTVIDFTSEYCGPCMQMRPYLQELGKSRADIVVRSFDINRMGVEGIDWKSPLAKRYKINSVPFLQIYDAKGKLIADGTAATAQVQKVINQDVLGAGQKE